MAKQGLAIIAYVLINLCILNNASASPAQVLVRELSNSVLRVKVNLPDGKHGLGSAVVVAKDEVITNCHVVNDATDITVVQNGEEHIVTAIKPDWHHDLCILKVEHLNAPIVKMGSTKNLKYGVSVFTIGYPDETVSPISTYGEVKGLFPMDGSMVMRASSSFRLGASGGGAFDDDGNLVGIITLKSKGNQAYYFYMPVEWVEALLHSPTKSLGGIVQKPFWASAEKERPYFMRVVHPYQTGDWNNVLAIAQEWSTCEPNTAEAWFYVATAEYARKDYASAEAHFQKVLSLKQDHHEASQYLAKISNKLSNIKLASN